jgi:hypothetical protein
MGNVIIIALALKNVVMIVRRESVQRLNFPIVRPMKENRNSRRPLSSFENEA